MKAKTFGDDDAAQAILDTSMPNEQKAIGRRVKNYDDEVWAECRKEYVYLGSYAKYSQNPDLYADLMATGKRKLVEASPYDRIWGIGLHPDDDLVLDEANWNGLNLLGEVLTELRDFFRVKEMFDAAESDDEDNSVFVCPRCFTEGRWGTTFEEHENGLSTATGHCNGFIIAQGENVRRCDFTWNREDDDKYFEEKK